MTGGAKLTRCCHEIITGALVQKLQVLHCLRVKFGSLSPVCTAHTMHQDKAWTPQMDLTLHLGRGAGGSQGKGLHFLESGMGKGILPVMWLQGVSSVFW